MRLKGAGKKRARCAQAAQADAQLVHILGVFAACKVARVVQQARELLAQDDARSLGDRFIGLQLRFCSVACGAHQRTQRRRQSQAKAERMPGGGTKKLELAFERSSSSQHLWPTDCQVHSWGWMLTDAQCGCSAAGGWQPRSKP